MGEIPPPPPPSPLLSSPLSLPLSSLQPTGAHARDGGTSPALVSSTGVTRDSQSQNPLDDDDDDDNNDDDDDDVFFVFSFSEMIWTLRLPGRCGWTAASGCFPGKASNL